MADIAQSLGLTKAALYYYVKNKEEILYESHVMTYDLMDEVLAAHDASNMKGLKHLEAVFRDFVGLLTQSGVSLLTDVASLKGEWRNKVLTRRNHIERCVVDIVQAGQKDGSIRAGDARLHVFFFMGALNWLNAWYEADGRLKADDITDHFVMQLRSGIAPAN